MSIWEYYLAIFTVVLVCSKDVFVALFGSIILFFFLSPLILILDPIIMIIKMLVEGLFEELNRKAMQKAEERQERTAKQLNKKVLYGLLAIAASIVIIFLMVKPGSEPGATLDTSARLGQITISYPSSWVRGDDGSIYVKENDTHSGLLMWTTAGDYHGTRGIKEITAILSESTDFNGELSETSIDGVKSYRQAIILDGMTGEALFVPTDEGVTVVLGAMPPEDQELQATLKRILDTAVLTPGTECAITVTSQGMTQHTDVVYDYGEGATWTLNVVDESGAVPTLSTGEVITGWRASDPSVSIVKVDEGVWKISGITCDVTIDAVWGMPE